jgi:hypothetical protein
MSTVDSLPPAGRCTCFKVRRLARQLTARYDSALAGSGLTVTQYAALSTLARADEPLPVARLARELGMDRTTTSRLVHPLERDGRLARADCAAGCRCARSSLVITGGGGRLRGYPGWELSQRVAPTRPRTRRPLRSVADAATANGSDRQIGHQAAEGLKGHR